MPNDRITPIDQPSVRIFLTIFFLHFLFCFLSFLIYIVLNLNIFSFLHLFLYKVNKNGTPLGSTHPSIGVTVRGNTMNPSVPVSLNPSRWDDSAPSFRLIEEFDDYGNYIDDPRKRRQVGLPCDGKTIYDDPTCLESINVVSFFFSQTPPNFFYVTYDIFY